MVQRLKKIDEVESARRQRVVVQIRSQVLDHRRELDLFRLPARAVDGHLADVDPGERTERVSAAFEDAIQVPGAAAQGKGITGIAVAEIPIAHPFNPVRVASSSNQVVVIQVDLRDACPRDAFEIVNERVGRKTSPAACDLA